MSDYSFSVTELQPTSINTIHFGRQGIAIGVAIISFIDKDTKMNVSYVPSLEISGYGDTSEESMKMVEFSINEFLKHLWSLSSKKREQELRDLGWEHHKLKNRDFSKAYVDISGELQNLNAEEGSVETKVLQVA